MSVRSSTFVFLLLLGAVVAGLSLGSAAALAAPCPNEAFRFGPSAALPDCRAYEQVTPVDKGRTEDITFKNSDQALVAEEGSAIFLNSPTPLEPGATEFGTRAVFTRNAAEWAMTSIAPAGEEAADYLNGESGAVFANPSLSRVGFAKVTLINGLAGPFSERTYAVGPPGGPDAVIAKTPYEKEGWIAGATPDFDHVYLQSADHTLAPAAEGTEERWQELYEWSPETGRLQPVNLTNTGTLLDTCGATLGGGVSEGGYPSDIGAVSGDGSKVFFEGYTEIGGALECPSPAKGVFMRLDGRETVEISAPEPGAGDPAGEYLAHFQGATPDGSQVLFASEAELTPDDHMHATQLYDYNTVTRKLTRVTRGESGVAEGNYRMGSALISEDGSTIYFDADAQLTADAAPVSGGAFRTDLYRYETATGATRFIAAVEQLSERAGQEVETTANGNILAFAGVGAVEDGPGSFTSPGGVQQIFRYDATGNTLVCASCGPHEEASSYWPRKNEIVKTADSVDRLHAMSADGSMVFFQTTQQLVPQDTNSTVESEGGSSSPGMDVYEWEQNGTGGCESTGGCQRLISSGNGSTASIFLGASPDGANVYFATGAQLVAADKDEFDDIYDARIDGGFPPPPSSPGACLSCQGVGSPPPLFSTPSSFAFTGAGNPAAPAPIAVKARKAHGKPKRKAAKRRKAGSRGAKPRRKPHRAAARGLGGNTGSSTRRGR